MLNSCCVVDIGRRHKTNDDCALLNSSIIDDGFYFCKLKENKGLFAIADGIGSLANSKEASKITLQTLSFLNDFSIDGINLKISEICNKINEYKVKVNLKNEIGTTLSGVYLKEENILTFNVGNSSVFRFRNGFLQKLTTDHTIIKTLIDIGKITEEEGKKHPQKNIITRCLGSLSSMTNAPDIIEQKINFSDSDIIVISSDGIFEHLIIDDLENILKKDIELLEKAKEIIDLANSLGGHDNMSIILIEKINSN